MTGLTLAQYRIDAELGRGGMGIVYKATDTKLNRTVALKVLPAAALASEDDRARFFREAQSAAQLSHPNIATVYQIDEAMPVDDAGEKVTGHTDRVLYIAMEYVEGESLADLVKRGPFRLQDAVSYAGQVAEALKEAHAKGIVHRDIKSANVMVTAAGVAKVLDFGLAKTQASTMLTRMGSTLGTVAYMSPEQARGHEVDGRTDLYSLGTMLYELVAGRLPFAGDYEQAILYGILNEPPEPLTAVRTGVPMQLEWIVNKLLAKEADYRYQTAGDLLADLKTLDLSGSGMSRRSMAAVSAAAVPFAAPSRQGLPIWVWAAPVLTAVLAAGLVWFLRPAPESPPAPIKQFSIPLAEFSAVAWPHGDAAGRYVVLAAVDSSGVPANHLWDLATGERLSVDGSDSRAYPKLSPDGDWVLTGSGGGGLFLARTPSGRAILTDSSESGAWLDAQNLLVGLGSELRLYRLNLTERDKVEIRIDPVDTSYVSFHYLQVDRTAGVALLTAVRRGGGAGGGASDVLSVNLSTGQVATVVRDACCALPHRDRYLVYLSGTSASGQLVAQRLAPEGDRVTGNPVNLTESAILSDWDYGMGEDDSFYIVAQAASQGQAWEKVYEVDPDGGRSTPLPFANADYDRLAVSPDGRRIAIERAASGGPNAGTHIFVLDRDTGTESRLTYNVAVNRAPIWTRSGKIYFFGGPDRMSSSIYAKNADGTGEETLVVPNGAFPSVSGDEEWVAFTRNEDVYAYDVAKKEIVAIDTSAGRQMDAAISPNGRFVAYTTDPRGGDTVSSEQRLFVRSFPDPNRQFVQVFEGRGDDPVWAPDGKTLYFRDGGIVYRVPVDTEGAFRALSAPQRIATFPTDTPRVAANPATGQLYVMAPMAAGTFNGSVTMDVTLSFSRRLEELLSGIGR